MTDILSQLLSQLRAIDLSSPSTIPLWVWVGGGSLALMFLRMVYGLVCRRPKPQVDPAFNDEERADDLFGGFTDALAAQIPESKKEHGDFASLLRQAGLYGPRSAKNLYALRFVLLFAPLASAAVLAIAAPGEYSLRILIVGGVLAAALSIAPRLYVFFRRRRRQQEIREGLADMMDMLSMCIGGGMPISASLDHVSANLTNFPALAQELQILKRQAEVSSLKLALRDLARRLDMPEVRQVASLLARGDQLGTGMSESLLDQADHFRSMRRQWATSQANKTPVKLTLPIVFCFAPAALILLISPALMELNDFLYPQNGQGILVGNETLATDQIVETLESLDQSYSQDR